MYGYFFVINNMYYIYTYSHNILQFPQQTNWTNNVFIFQSNTDFKLKSFRFMIIRLLMSDL